MWHGATRIRLSLRRRFPSLMVCVVWLLAVCWTFAALGRPERIFLISTTVAASVATFFLIGRAERARWIVPARAMADRIRALPHQRSATVLEPTTQDFALLARSVEELRAHFRGKLRFQKLTYLTSQARATPPPAKAIQGGVEFENAFSPESGEFNLAQSGDYSTVDMVNRLDPETFVWIESSIAEQCFLGWSLGELRGKSFLDVVHRDDRKSASDTLRQAVDRGESLGQVVRLVTSSGEEKDIELNVGARYGDDRRLSHLRCHVTDVTEKVRSEREIRLRTLEVTRANEQLLRINRELEELKDRYTDLYQNAPAMYFSLDAEGLLTDCNQTLLATLERTRDETLGGSYAQLLPQEARDGCSAGFGEFFRKTSMEVLSQWQKSNGEIIEVWISASLIRGTDDKMIQARCVAQDVTTRRRLEAEVLAKNESLGRANAELSLKNRELDDFVYVVSHDLQEPLRTLIAFSDFLLKDYGDRFDDEGREYVNYLIDASRRMRAMILAMLNLSRAGKVIGEFAPVDLNELVAIVKADLGELIRDKHAEIRLVGPLPTVWGDWNRLTQLFANLFINGLKYNRSVSPWVEVGVVSPDLDTSRLRSIKAAIEGPDSKLTLYFKDNGIGIDPEFHQTIFQLFRRLHTQDEYEGTGAGLAICSKIVQAHGGRIWVESPADGGSTFFVRLRAHSPRQLGNDRIVGPASLSAIPQDRADES